VHVTVITPAYNVAPYIHDTVSSVLAQTHAQWSMVVVDDGSTDSTADCVAGYRDPRIRLIRQSNAGVSAARNRGIAEATATDAILFLDGDDWLVPTALADLAATLRDHPASVAASARYIRVHPDGKHVPSHPPPHGHLLPRLLVRNPFVNGGHLLIRAGAVALAGAFRNDLNYGEDWEYWTRLALLGPVTATAADRPVLFLRERPGSAYHSNACDPKRHAAMHRAIHANPAIVATVGLERLQTLRRAIAAETAWTIGREFVRHGNRTAGSRWLCTSLLRRPSLKRLCMMPLAWTATGPFRPYRRSTTPQCFPLSPRDDEE
jgi:glycosyltransferase involved in cell wall biosynthesis